MPDLHAHDADVIIERFAFGKLADLIDNDAPSSRRGIKANLVSVRRKGLELKQVEHFEDDDDNDNDSDDVEDISVHGS